MNSSTRDRLESAAREAQNSLNARGRYATSTMDALSRRWHDDAEPMVDDLTDRALDVARQSARWMRDGSDRMRLQVVRASDRAVDYVRDQPVRSVLMGAAAGALLYAALRSLMQRSR